MFCVLSVKGRNKTIFEKLFGKLMLDDYSVKTIPVYKGAPFFALDITTSRKEINWENVVLSVGKCASRLLLNSNIRIPDDMNVGIFRSQLLYNKMMKNTILEILENNKNKLRSVSVMDRGAENTDFVKQLSKYASSMSICTENKENYSEICEEITDETGMCPVMTNDFCDAEIKINTKTLAVTIFHNNKNMNISAGVDFSVPEVYEKLLQEGIDRYDFYSAIYELCGVFSLGETIFDTIMVDNEKKRVQDIHFS